MATPERSGHDSSSDRLPDALRATLLLNKTRQRIMGLLQVNPGLNPHQLAKLLDVNVNTIRFHIRRLSRQGFVETRTLPEVRETFCFTAENVRLWENSATRLLLGRGTTRDVALYLAGNPAVSADEIAEALGISVYSVRRHIRSLDEQQLVSRLRVERQVLYHAGPDLVEWAEEAKSRSLFPSGADVAFEGVD